jgi:lysophospholipase L1-like esterase
MFRQIAILQPDLIIVSLGTNDAQGQYRAEVARANIRSFMTKMEAANPQSAILFTLPPDSYKRGKQNADLARLADEITDYASQKGHAWWDLSEVMGGKGSVTKWRGHKMAASDLLHYTPKGYMLQDI